MAAKVFDLSSYLEGKKSVIKVGNEEFEVSDGFNDILRIDALSNRRDEMDGTEFVQEFLRIALGEESANYLVAKNLPFKFYVEVMHCIEQVYSGDDETEGASEGAKPSLV